MSDAATINATGEAIKSLLMADEEAYVVALGAKAANTDCDLSSCTVSITGTVGGPTLQTFTGNAVGMFDAAMIARGKLRRAREAAKEERAKKKAAADA